ncbi:peptidylprolyl isomerase [Paenibacillus albicereus]|uniref:Peptidyl-prolyl cis-trans isomerase n=2 Tax=Paenibacillus albicereus TaxID=2726185 RepID=A0A6H2H3P5_9BACL|nr:peptidylprolyl isomerase [Paenibacillus albicereus]
MHASLSALLLASALVLGGCGAKSDQDASGGAGGAPAGTPVPSSSPAPSAEPSKQWDKAPDMAIDPNKTYKAVVKTTEGEFTINLFAKDAPQTVNNFVFLSKEGFYEGVVFHRIIQEFMIQTGDPTGTGAGGPGYSIPDELNNGHSYVKYVVAMANAGPNTGGSQFFIGTGDSVRGLDAQPNYAIFGEIESGQDVVDKIAATPVGPSDAGNEVSKPQTTVKMESIEIRES